MKVRMLDNEMVLPHEENNIGNHRVNNKIHLEDNPFYTRVKT